MHGIATSFYFTADYFRNRHQHLVTFSQCCLMYIRIKVLKGMLFIFIM